MIVILKCETKWKYLCDVRRVRCKPEIQYQVFRVKFWFQYSPVNIWIKKTLNPKKIATKGFSIDSVRF